MYAEKIKRSDQYTWQIEPFGDMKVKVVVYANEQLIKDIDEDVLTQAANVAKLPGIVKASYVMPDAHLGYGFPIGGVAAFDPDKQGVVSAGGVGFDISCGVRALTTKLTLKDIDKHLKTLADSLAQKIPAGVGSSGKVKLSKHEIDDMLTNGAAWAVEKGYGSIQDLTHCEENGKMTDAMPDYVSNHAKERQQNQTGTLGSGNHYLEIQRVTNIYDKKAADAFGLFPDQLVVSIHCGSRGLGHQVATDYMPKMVKAAQVAGIALSQKQLACAPINSTTGQQYLGAMRAAINSALANRQLLTHLVRQVFSDVLGQTQLSLLYDVSHNTCKKETYAVEGKKTQLYVHRKGATRAFGPQKNELPHAFKNIGQPVLIGGTMGTSSFILRGNTENENISFCSCCHGAGRAMSRKQANKNYRGSDIVNRLAQRNILIRCASMRGVAEEAPDAYKDVEAVVDASHMAKLANKVARLQPVICVKG
jgi:tRNA-splicing ligase RtcB